MQVPPAEIVAREIELRPDMSSPEKIRNSGIMVLCVVDVFQVLHDLGYMILRREQQLDSSHVAAFSNTVARWCTPRQIKPDDQVEPDDINGEQVLATLQSEGWTVIPPPVG